MTSDGCVHFTNRFPSQLKETDLLQYAGPLTVDNCMALCNAGKNKKGGVGKNKCCVCLTCLFNEHSFLHRPNFTLKDCGNETSGTPTDIGGYLSGE